MDVPKQHEEQCSVGIYPCAQVARGNGKGKYRKSHSPVLWRQRLDLGLQAQVLPAEHIDIIVDGIMRHLGHHAGPWDSGKREP